MKKSKPSKVFEEKSKQISEMKRKSTSVGLPVYRFTCAPFYFSCDAVTSSVNANLYKPDLLVTPITLRELEIEIQGEESHICVGTRS